MHRICASTGWPVGHASSGSGCGTARWAPTTIWYLDVPERRTVFQQVTQTVEFAAGEGIIGRVGALGKPEWRVDVTTDPTFHRRHAALEAGLNWCCRAILVGHEVAGVLEFYASESLEPHTALLEALTQIGTQLGRVVERRRAAEQPLLQQQEALVQQEKLAAMSTMPASVAHELNNPLAIILVQAGF